MWPWLVQIGADRGGFYSYESLENLFGLGIRNSDVIVPAWQQREVGDLVFADAKGSGGWFVMDVLPGEALVLQVGDVREGRPIRRDEKLRWEFSWSFVVQPAADGRSRLLVRERRLRLAAHQGGHVAGRLRQLRDDPEDVAGHQGPRRGRGPAGERERRVRGVVMDRVLVAYGSKYGATAEIAEAIGTALRAHGLEADVRRARSVRLAGGVPRGGGGQCGVRRPAGACRRGC